ncbi:MAG: hypothetical protein Q8O14_01160 [bacterium]|jgi:hypothetical protein|nr:hypothetical protein [bacterium]
MINRSGAGAGRRLAARLPWALLALLLVAGMAGAAWVNVRTVKGAKRAMVDVDGKARVYWQLDKGGAMKASVNGPAVLRVVARAPWRSKLKGKENLISWNLDGQPGGTLRLPMVRSRTVHLQPPKEAPEFATPAKWPRLSASITEEIRIPYGTHDISFQTEGLLSENVFLRLQSKALQPMPKGGTVDLLPRGGGATRNIAVQDKRATYQVLASGSELQLDVTGPTVVKVISRLDWNTTMTGQQKYQLKVHEDGLLKNTWVLRGRRSTAATYVGKDNTMPARGEVIYIEVPAGRHQYAVKFQDSGREVNLRFLMPREALRHSGS